MGYAGEHMKYGTIEEFNSAQNDDEKLICKKLMQEIDSNLPQAESKIWHGHPVWFLDENPIVSYSKLKGCIRLMFWSGADFDEPELKAGTGKFKDASVRYTNLDQISVQDLKRWLKKSTAIQWDYKNIYKRRGKLVRLV